MKGQPFVKGEKDHNEDADVPQDLSKHFLVGFLFSQSVSPEFENDPSSFGTTPLWKLELVTIEI
jgi:hypothetical protein